MIAPTVFVIDDDEGSRKSMGILFGAHEIRVESYDSGMAFLDALATYDQAKVIGCIVTDLNMPGLSGLDVYEKAMERGWKLPTIIITAFGEVPSCAAAFKAGVVDYLEKPVSPDELIVRVRECMKASRMHWDAVQKCEESTARLKSLTKKEAQVMELLVSGLSMKTIAADFGTSFQAVSRHRQKILEKLGVEGDVPLARWVLEHRRVLANEMQLTH